MRFRLAGFSFACLAFATAALAQDVRSNAEREAGRFDMIESLIPLFLKHGMVDHAARLRRLRLAWVSRTKGASSLDLAGEYITLGAIYMKSMDCKPAVEALNRANELLEPFPKAVVGRLLVNIFSADCLQRWGNAVLAESLLRDSIQLLKIHGPQVDPDLAWLGTVKVSLAGILSKQGRLEEAAALLDWVIDYLDTRFMRDGARMSPDALALRGITRLLANKTEAAVDDLRTATSAINSVAGKIGIDEGGFFRSYLLDKRRNIPKYLIAALAKLGTKDAARIEESLKLADYAEHGETTSAIALLTASEKQKGSKNILELMVSTKHPTWRRKYRTFSRLAELLAVESDDSFSKKLSVSLNEAMLVAADAGSGLNGFVALEAERTEESLIGGVQSLLRPKEILIRYLLVKAWNSGPDELFVWAITNSGVRWREVDLEPGEFEQLVSRVRCGLDETLWFSGSPIPCPSLVRAGPFPNSPNDQLPPFDAPAAHRLYKLLIEPFDLDSDKRLLIIPSMSAPIVPFNALITLDPGPITADPRQLARLSWLGITNPITIFPSVSSFVFLRKHAKVRNGASAYLGVGNPLFEGPSDDPQRAAYYRAQAEVARARKSCLRTIRPSPKTPPHRSGYSLLRSYHADANQIREALPLPETAEEICAVRSATERGDTLLAAEASETRLKQLSATGALQRYSIIHFATHAVLPGQIAGDQDPGILLSPPNGNGDDDLDQDDGFLSASEISDLKLDTNLVILSACNTASGSANDTQDLSGLARAFFYAGARSLIVSNWQVDSVSTVQLTVGALSIRKSAPDEALRQAMQSMIDSSNPQAGHPSYWAPFMVVGEAPTFD